MKKKLTRSFFSHLAAVAVGTACAYAIRSQSDKDPTAPVKPRIDKLNRETKIRSGDEMIDHLQLAVADRKAKQRLTNGGELQAMFAQLSKSLKPSADPKGTFFKLQTGTSKAGDSSESNHLNEEQTAAFVSLAVRYAQWFHQDPRDALAGISPGDDVIRSILNQFTYSIARPLYQEQGLRSAMDWLVLMSDHPGVFQIVGEDLGRRKSVEDLTWLLQNHPDFTSASSFRKCADKLGKHWTVANRDQLPPLLKGTACAGFMLGIAARMEGTSGIEWIRSWIDSGKLDPSAAAGLSNNSMISKMAYDNKRPVNDRIAVLRLLEAREETTDSQLQEQMASTHVSQFLNGEDDWLYAFRHGQVTAQQVIDAALAASPKLGDAEDEFRNHLFRHLAEDNAVAAMSVLDGRTDEDKVSQKTLATRWWFIGVEPDRFYEVISSIPDDGDADRQKILRRSWLDKSARNLERFGEDYLTWVKTLPAGQNRKWALESVLEASKRPYPWISAEAKALLGGRP